LVSFFQLLIVGQIDGCLDDEGAVAAIIGPFLQEYATHQAGRKTVIQGYF